MDAKTIPHDRWREELDRFSRQHEGWIVSVTIEPSARSARVEAHDMPLQGVVADRDDAIAVIVGDTADARVTHEVPHAVTVRIEMTDVGAERALLIQDASGSTTTVAFRAPMRPDEVDGVDVGHPF